MLPPLRVRREDIPPLIERYWRATAATGDAAARGRCSRPTLATLANAHWPGNLDQLASVVSNLALLRGDIGRRPREAAASARSARPRQRPVAPEITARFFDLPLREAREAFERIYFEQLLGREQSNMSRVAERAGLERTHLYRKLKQLNIRFSRRGDDTRRLTRADFLDERHRRDHGAQQPMAPADARGDRRRVRRHRHLAAVHDARRCSAARYGVPLDARQRARPAVARLLGAR